VPVLPSKLRTENIYFGLPYSSVNNSLGEKRVRTHLVMVPSVVARGRQKFKSKSDVERVSKRK
jgi:hypothetical protein